MKLSSPLTAVAAVLATTFACQVAVAQTTVTTAETMAVPVVTNMGFSDRDRMKPWNGDKESLAQALTHQHEGARHLSQIMAGVTGTFPFA